MILTTVQFEIQNTPSATTITDDIPTGFVK